MYFHRLRRSDWRPAGGNWRLAGRRADWKALAQLERASHSCMDGRSIYYCEFQGSPHTGLTAGRFACKFPGEFDQYTTLILIYSRTLNSQKQYLTAVGRFCEMYNKKKYYFSESYQESELFEGQKVQK